jgi:hypothetical protein
VLSAISKHCSHQGGVYTWTDTTRARCVLKERVLVTAAGLKAWRVICVCILEKWVGNASEEKSASEDLQQHKQSLLTAMCVPSAQIVGSALLRQLWGHTNEPCLTVWLLELSLAPWAIELELMHYVLTCEGGGIILHYNPALAVSEGRQGEGVSLAMCSQRKGMGVTVAAVISRQILHTWPTSKHV